MQNYLDVFDSILTLRTPSGELNEEIGFFPANRIRLETPQDLGNVFCLTRHDRLAGLQVYVYFFTS